MSNNFYTSVAQYGKNLLYRGYDENCKRVQKRVPYKPTVYIESKKATTEWTGLDGQNVEPLQMSSMREFKEFVKTHGSVTKLYGNKKSCDKVLKQTDQIDSVLHLFSKSDSRVVNNKFDIKGSLIIEKVLKKIEKYYKFKFFILSGIKKENIKYFLHQSDIVIDQLYFGRYGSISREALSYRNVVLSNIRK